MIRLDNQELSAIKLDDKEITRKMIDGVEIWSSQKVIFLGTAPQSIKNIIKDYSEKTMDNFFICKPLSSFSFGRNADRGESLDWLTLQLSSSYNQTTGQCDWKAEGLGTGTSRRMEIAYVDKPDKLISLGEGQSWNIKSLYPTKYQNFTADNFLLKVNNRSINVNTGRNWEYMSGSCEIRKSYNAQTGILTASFRTNIHTLDVNAYLFTGRYKEL